jgi:hypothetical protein
MEMTLMNLSLFEAWMYLENNPTFIYVAINLQETSSSFLTLWIYYPGGIKQPGNSSVWADEPSAKYSNRDNYTMLHQTKPTHFKFSLLTLITVNTYITYKLWKTAFLRQQQNVIAFPYKMVLLVTEFFHWICKIVWGKLFCKILKQDVRVVSLNNLAVAYSS